MSVIPYLGIRYGHNLVIFSSNRAEFFMVPQKTIIYRLVMRNRDFDEFKNNVFLPGK